MGLIKKKSPRGKRRLYGKTVRFIYCRTCLLSNLQHRHYFLAAEVVAAAAVAVVAAESVAPVTD